MQIIKKKPRPVKYENKKWKISNGLPNALQVIKRIKWVVGEGQAY